VCLSGNRLPPQALPSHSKIRPKSQWANRYPDHTRYLQFTTFYQQGKGPTCSGFDLGEQQEGPEWFGPSSS
ncbi:MAG: hypothetical protein KC587_10505, partial [Nitrospira sp.]|nr:hypothetical protein [Nitrospira sp.]